MDRSSLVEAVARAIMHPSSVLGADTTGEGRSWSRRARAALLAIEAAGYRIVPVEATEEHLRIGVRAYQDRNANGFFEEDTLADWRAFWSAMLAAVSQDTGEAG